MTEPREVIADYSYMFTRRCAFRMFLLRPDPEMNEAYIYCVGVAAQRYGIDLTSLSTMSNHHHPTAVDRRGNYPAFIGYLHSLLARCGNCIRGRWENFWAAEQPGALRLVDAEAHLDKMVYALTNPVTAHLVDTVFNWPGVNSLRYQLNDRPMVAKRPKKFFDADGDMPEQVSIRFVRPPGYEHLTHEEWAALLLSEVRKRERQAAEERRRRGIRLLGRKAVRRQSPFSLPKTITKRRGMVPRVATRNKWLRIEQLRRNKMFQLQYRRAWLRRRDGDIDVEFPFGTYQLHVFGLVRCKLRPPSLE